MIDRKLRAVTRHEFMTVVKQPSFWITMVSLPLILGLIILINYIGNRDSQKQLDQNRVKEYSITVVDESGLVKNGIADQYGLKLEADSDNVDGLVSEVREGKLDGLIVYPADLAKSKQFATYYDKTERDGDTTDIDMEQLAGTLVQQSVLSDLPSPDLAALATGETSGKAVTFENGEQTPGFESYIVPGAFLIIFYLILVFSVGYALSAVADEKENRSIEMVLSYVRPKTLMLGKLLGVTLVTLLQLLFFAVIGLLAYLVLRAFGNELSLPFAISNLVFSPAAMLIGAAYLLVGFLLFLSLMVAIGAIFPSAKEANNFTIIFFLAPAIPFWMFKVVTTQPDNIATQILTYFPLSAPTTGLLRNTVGNLPIIEALISLGILLVVTVLILRLADKAFRLGTLELNNRVKLSSILKSK